MLRQLGHAQNAGQHRLELQETKMMQPGKAHVAGQDHPQNETEHRHRARLPLDRQGFLDQLLETQLFQHDRHWKQTTVGGQIVRGEVIGRQSPEFIRLWNNA